MENERLAGIGRLAAGVAHEVRNPLAVIRSSASLLLEGLDPEAEDAHTAGRFITEEVDRLDGFIGTLLDFSRPLAPERAVVELPPLLRRVEILGSDQAARVGFEFAVEPVEGQVEGDEDQLAQALFTLVVNAGEATGAGGRVQLRAAVNGEVAFEVADDGPGVSAESAARIFEPFFTTKARGTGLGLPMAARIAAAHGGALELRPRAGLGPEGRGACFRLRLPEGA